MKRREFITLLGGVAVAWPFAVHAQQVGSIRRIGVLMSWDESDPEIKTFLSGFMQGLAELGWTDGGNVRMEVRWAGGNADRLRMFAKELVHLQPDVILATSTPATAALQQATRTIPIVFAGISDPVGAGFVASLSRPGGISLASSTWKGHLRASGWRCSRRSRPASSEPQSCSIPTRLLVVDHIICPHSMPQPESSKSSRSQRAFVASPKSKRS
jgi:hypothetical protein